MTENKHGSRGAAARIKIVRRALADGTIREYRYDRELIERRRFVARRQPALLQLQRAYFESAEFKALAPFSAWAARYYLGLCAERLGWMTIEDIQRREARAKFYALRDALADRPAKADMTITFLRALLGWAYDRGMIEVNHAIGLKRLAARATRAERIWRPEDEAAFLARAEPLVARAFRLALLTGARIGDLVRLTHGDIDRDGWLVYTPAKTARSTAVVVHLPTSALPPLAALVAPRGEDDRARPLLGAELGVDSLRRKFEQARARAGLDGADLHWHDLRGTAASRMMAAGCTEAEIGAILGHHLARGTLRAYAARSRDLALAAYTKWARALAARPEIIDLQARKTRRKTPENTG